MGATYAKRFGCRRGKPQFLRQFAPPCECSKNGRGPFSAPCSSAYSTTPASPAQLACPCACELPPERPGGLARYERGRRHTRQTCPLCAPKNGRGPFSAPCSLSGESRTTTIGTLLVSVLAGVPALLAVSACPSTLTFFAAGANSQGTGRFVCTSCNTHVVQNSASASLLIVHNTHDHLVP